MTAIDKDDYEIRQKFIKSFFPSPSNTPSQGTNPRHVARNGCVERAAAKRGECCAESPKSRESLLSAIA